MIWIQVAFVAIGATMVGSITFTKKKGDHVKKGDEVSKIQIDFCLFIVCLHCLLTFHFLKLQFGYFSFGGSTVICVFEKVGVIIDVPANSLSFIKF